MEDKKRKILMISLIALLILLVIGIIVCVILLNTDKDPAVQNNSNNSNQIVPDYPPQETDPHQSPMDNDPGGTLEVEDGGAGVNLTYTATATVDLSEEKVTLYYANPSKSTQDMVVALVIDDKVICRSQRITPGNQIRELSLAEGVKDSLKADGSRYDAQYVVGCYNPETNEKAIVELIGSGVVVTVVE